MNKMHTEQQRLKDINLSWLAWLPRKEQRTHAGQGRLTRLGADLALPVRRTDRKHQVLSVFLVLCVCVVPCYRDSGTSVHVYLEIGRAHV